MTVTLHELGTGGTGCVVSVDGANGNGSRMLAMGLTPGTRIRVERVAPLGDPIEIRLRGYSLMIRRSEACQITVRLD